MIKCQLYSIYGFCTIPTLSKKAFQAKNINLYTFCDILTIRLENLYKKYSDFDFDSSCYLETPPVNQPFLLIAHPLLLTLFTGCCKLCLLPRGGGLDRLRKPRLSSD